MPVPESIGRGPAADDPSAPFRINCQQCRRCLFSYHRPEQEPVGGADAVYEAWGCPNDCGGVFSAEPDPGVIAEFDATDPDKVDDDPDVFQRARALAATVSYTGRPNISAGQLRAAVTADPRFQMALADEDPGAVAASSDVPPPPGEEFPIPPPIRPGSSDNPPEPRAGLRRTDPAMAALLDTTAIVSPTPVPGFTPAMGGDGWVMVSDKNADVRLAALTTPPAGDGVETVTPDEVPDDAWGHGPADEPDPEPGGEAEVVELGPAPKTRDTPKSRRNNARRTNQTSAKATQPTVTQNTIDRSTSDDDAREQ